MGYNRLGGPMHWATFELRHIEITHIKLWRIELRLVIVERFSIVFNIFTFHDLQLLSSSLYAPVILVLFVNNLTMNTKYM